mgnify:CR=1 FL=1
MSKWKKPLEPERRDEKLQTERRLCAAFREVFGSAKGLLVLEEIKEMCLHDKDPFLQGMPHGDLSYLVGKQAIAKQIMFNITRTMESLK